MKYTYVIPTVILLCLAVGLVVLLVVDWSELSVPNPRSGTEPPAGSVPIVTRASPPALTHRPSSPITQPARALTDEQFTAKLDQVRRQLGPGFQVEIVKPFVVAGDLSAEDFDRICQGTIRWAVDMLNKDFFSEPLQQIITIYLFRDQQSYHQHSRSLFAQEPTTPYGYYLPQHQALVMNIATGTGTLVHEMVHPLLAADFPQAPSWFDEGLASLYEQCRQRDEHIVGLLNWRLPVLQDGLRAGHFVALEKLLATSRDEFYDDPHGMHYAQARYLCYYLQEQRALRSFCRQFKKNCSTDPTGVATLLRITGQSSLKQLETQWLQFLAPLRYEP